MHSKCMIVDDKITIIGSGEVGRVVYGISALHSRASHRRSRRGINIGGAHIAQSLKYFGEELIINKASKNQA